MAKSLEVTTTTIKGSRVEFNLIFHSAKSQSTHSFRVNYVVCPPTKVVLLVLDLTQLFPSTLRLLLPSLEAKNIQEEAE